MKKIYLLLLCFYCLLLNGQNTRIKLSKVTINAQDKYPIRGYLVHVDSDKIVLAPKKKLVKKFLLSKNCATCYTVPTKVIRDLKIVQKKAFLPIGLIASGILGIVIETNTNGTTPHNAPPDIRKAVAVAGITAGVTMDVVRLINHAKRRLKLDGNIGQLSKILESRAAIYQFNKLRSSQLNVLSNILAQIKKDKTSYRKKVKIYLKDKKLIAGYIIGQKEKTLLLSLDKKEIIKYRNNPPHTLYKIPLKNIFYYEFERNKLFN